MNAPSLFKIQFDVPFHGSKKNDKRAGFRMNSSGKVRPFIRQGVRTADLRDFILAALKRWQRANPEFKQITTDVNATFLFYFPENDFFTQKGFRCANLIDMSNAYQMYEDCLQKVGIIKNDGLICSHYGSERLPTTDTSCSILIWLTGRETQQRKPLKP